MLQSTGSQRVRHDWAAEQQQREFLEGKMDLSTYLPMTVKKASVTQLGLDLCDPIDYSPLGSSVNGIFQARILEWFAISSPGDLPDPGVEPGSSALAGRFFTTEPPRKPKSPPRKSIQLTISLETNLRTLTNKKRQRG